MSNPIGPSNPDYIFDTLITTDDVNTNTTNVTQQQSLLDSLEILSSTAASGLSAGSPILSILEFARTISKGLLDKKEADKTFDLADSNNYRELHISLADSAVIMKDKLVALMSFQEDYNTFISTSGIQNIATSLVNARNNYYAIINEQRNGESAFYRDWGNFSDARIRIYQGTTTQSQTNALIADYVSTRTIYNQRITNINNTIINMNAAINQGTALQADINKFNALIQSLGIAMPLITNFSTYPQPIPQLQLAPITPPPPWPSTLFFDPPQGFSLDLPVYPPPANAINLTAPAVPNSINNSNFKSTYIKPLQAAIKALKDLLDQTNIDIVLFTTQKLVFGQAVPGEVRDLPFANITTPVGTGGSSLLGAGSANKSQNAGISSSASQAKIDALFNVFGVTNASPLVGLIGGIPADIVAVLQALAVPGATKLAGGALVGDSPQQSPAVVAAVALNTVDEAVKLLSTGALEKVVLDKLLGSSELAGLSEEDLAKLAKGITAALSLEVIKLVVLDAAQAIGTSGLLPQLLANIGGVSAETILKFINGLINYQLLQQSPLGLELVKTSLSGELQKSQGLDQQQADIIIGKALDDFINQGPFSTDEASKDALTAALNKAIVDSGVPVDTARTIVDSGLDRIDNPAPPPPAPIASNDSAPPPPISDNLELSPQQQLQDDLKKTSFNSELKRELENSDLEKDDRNRIASRIDYETRNSSSLNDSVNITQSILNSEGVDNASTLVGNARDIVNSPLRSFLVSTPAPIQDLVDNFTFESSRLLSAQGIRSDVAADQSERFAKLIFDNPTSIASLTTRYLGEYSQAVGVTQAQAVADNFKDVMLPTRDLVAALTKNQANGIVFASNPIINGTSFMPKTGSGGGVPTVPIIG